MNQWGEKRSVNIFSLPLIYINYTNSNSLMCHHLKTCFTSSFIFTSTTGRFNTPCATTYRLNNPFTLSHVTGILWKGSRTALNSSVNDRRRAHVTNTGSLQRDTWRGFSVEHGGFLHAVYKLLNKINYFFKIKSVLQVVQAAKMEGQVLQKWITSVLYP